MAKYTTVLSGNTTGTLIVKALKPRDLNYWCATLNAYGNFGGGTLSYAISTDGGNTLVILKDYGGATYTATANDVVPIGPIGTGSTNSDAPLIYAVLSGATAPSLTIDVMDVFS